MVNLRTLINPHTQQSVKWIHFWLCAFTTWVLWCTSLPYVGILMHPSPAVTQHMNDCCFYWSSVLTFPWSKNVHRQIFLFPSNLNWCTLQIKSWNRFASLINRSLPIVKYSHHRCLSTPMAQDSFFSVQWLPWFVSWLDCSLLLYALSMILSLPQICGQHNKYLHYTSSLMLTLVLSYYG